ncbi:MAG: hypothetical protein BWY74_03145 [Firmicutes bacterium ADurb.Bin419]|nr:MAG: hypothetical protein BWY74_03145 [Firmicutes bacterium ADurb.Bin419]
MIYDDGYKLNKNHQVVSCPKCKNQEISLESEFCRICGTRVYNKCEGEWDDHDQEQYQHNCPGNARFCEICGKPTYFATEGYLKPWNEVQSNFEDNNYDEEPNQGNLTEDDELPF